MQKLSATKTHTAAVCCHYCRADLVILHRLVAPLLASLGQPLVGVYMADGLLSE